MKASQPKAAASGTVEGRTRAGRGLAGWTSRAVAVGALLTSALPACTGGSAGSAAGQPSLPGGAGAGAGTGGGGAVAPADTAAYVDQDSHALRRLVNAEYSQSLQDVLGEPAGAAERLKFPTDPREHGFDNNTALVQISAAHVVSYDEAAAAVARATFADPARRALVLSCEPAAAECFSTYVKELGLKLYRRPLAAEELASFAALTGASATDPLDKFAQVLEAMLQSPYFLHEVALGETVATQPTLVRLTGYELATRLSFFLWGTTPSSTLLGWAAAGRLDAAEGVASVVSEMLADARAQQGLRRFYGQWLPLAQTLGTDPAKFAPGVDVKSMVEEAEHFVDNVLWDAKASVFDLLTARYTFVNAAQAAVYGAPAPAAGAWAKLDFTTEPRSGILTQPAILAATAHGSMPSSTKRGQFVQEQLLCTQIAPPPQGVSAVIPPAEPGESERQQFARHTTNASCAACHAMMDPVGWGLSEFDGRGAFRSKDANGAAIDSAGKLQQVSPPEFHGPVELGEKLKAAPQFTACFSKQLFRYLYGRVETERDQPGIDELEAAFAAQSWSFTRGIERIASHDGFRYRSKGDAP